MTCMDECWPGCSTSSLTRLTSKTDDASCWAMFDLGITTFLFFSHPMCVRLCRWLCVLTAVRPNSISLEREQTLSRHFPRTRQWANREIKRGTVIEQEMGVMERQVAGDACQAGGCYADGCCSCRLSEQQDVE